MNPRSKRYAEVVLPLAVDHPLTYEVPEALMDRAAVGMRAIVPVKKRVETGYVVRLAEATEVDPVRLLIDLPDSAPIFSGEMLELAKWIAEYYCCSWGEALQCALPAGMRMRSSMRYTLVPEQLSAGRFTARQRKVIAALHRSGPMTERQLARAVGGGALSNTLQSLVARGLLDA